LPQWPKVQQSASPKLANPTGFGTYAAPRDVSYNAYNTHLSGILNYALELVLAFRLEADATEHTLDRLQCLIALEWHALPSAVRGPQPGRAWTKCSGTSPGADVASPGADVASPGADVASPGADVASPGADVASPGADVASPGADVASPGADVASPGADVAESR
jgi:hypothetical protein